MLKGILGGIVICQNNDRSMLFYLSIMRIMLVRENESGSREIVAKKDKCF